jgi:hypothetical protein
MVMAFHNLILPYVAGLRFLNRIFNRYGKIIDCMSNATIETKVVPPKLIPSLVEGFNAIANHIYIILLPVLLDLLLWFGPLVRIKEMLLPTVLEASELSASAYGEDSQIFLNTVKEMWTKILEQLNLLYGLRTYPVGVPSLLVNKGINQNPLGSMQVIELHSPNNAFWIVIGLSCAGLILGCLYFALIAGATGTTASKFSLSNLGKQIVQCLVLELILVMAMLVLSIPAICLISSAVLFLPSIGSLPLVIFGMVLVWILLPLVFTPHGIFASQFKATTSMANSFKLVRSLMSVTGMFFIILIVLGYGLDVLWSTPGPNNWMMLVGIFGHAFISSGLIAASFAYYNTGVKWMQVVFSEINTGKKKILS